VLGGAAAGGVLIIVLVIVLSSGGGGGTVSAPPAGGSNPTSGPTNSTPNTAAAAPPVVASTVNVAVINGCGVTGLAGHLTTELQGDGFTKAQVNTTPAPGGFHQTTTVEYYTGHKAQALAVQQAVGAGGVAPLSAAVASVVPNVPVVLVAGQDQGNKFEALTGASATSTNAGGTLTGP
jgi:hypothetical protein